MSDGHQPRKHDHLVEPMYQALGEREGAPPGPAERGRRDRALVWVLSLVSIAAAAALLYCLG